MNTNHMSNRRHGYVKTQTHMIESQVYEPNSLFGSPERERASVETKQRYSLDSASKGQTGMLNDSQENIMTRIKSDNFQSLVQNASKNGVINLKEAFDNSAT